MKVSDLRPPLASRLAAVPSSELASVLSAGLAYGPTWPWASMHLWSMLPSMRASMHLSELASMMAATLAWVPAKALAWAEGAEEESVGHHASAGLKAPPSEWPYRNRRSGCNWC